MTILIAIVATLYVAFGIGVAVAAREDGFFKDETNWPVLAAFTIITFWLPLVLYGQLEAWLCKEKP